MQFLIVDDAEAPLEQLGRVIEQTGHQVVGVARNGLEAVQQFFKLHPDVVVMDVIMPRMNGMDALKQIRAADPQAHVVMACSMRSCQTAMDSERNGAEYFLFKPYQEPVLRKIILKLQQKLQRPPTPAKTQSTP